MTGSGKHFSNKVYIGLWLTLVMISAVILWLKVSTAEQQYNAGLLAALEINSPDHQAALALGKNYQNKLLLLVGHQDLAQASLNANKIRQRLRSQPWLASLYSNPLNSQKLQQLLDYYGGSPFSHLSAENKKALQSAITGGNSKQLTENYFALLNQWADPIVSSSLTKDASLSLASFLNERLLAKGKSDSKWLFRQQELMLQGEKLSYIPIFISIAPEYTNIRDSVVIYQELQRIKAEYLLTNSSSDSEVLMTGMLLHSSAASLQAQSEISRFGLFSLLGVIVLIVLAFRAITPLLACLAVIGTALLVGIVALTLFFEAIHLLAFVFAVSILGIAVDYGFHILVLRQYSSESANSIRKKVFFPLTIALGSTLIGYSLFFITPISLLHQVVVFVGFGLVGAYLSALLLLPCIRFTSTGTLFAIQPKIRFSYIAFALIIFVVTVPTLKFDDNIANLNTKSAILVQEEQKVAQLTGENVYPYMVLVSGDSLESLLLNNQQLAEKLRAAKSEKNNVKLKSITDWQLPQVMQQENIDLVKANWQSGSFGTIATYLDEKIIARQLNIAKPLSSRPPFIAENIGVDVKVLADQYWTALLLSAPLNDEQTAILAQFSYAKYINLPSALSKQLSEVRVNVFQVALPALLAILLILSFYFGLSSALLMLLVPSLCAGLALVITGFFQTSLNIFNVLACLLIITLALDYVVFFRAHGVTKLISHTISLSALSSALTFGVMSFSQTPAVSSFGLTLLFGIILAWLLSHFTPLVIKQRSTKPRD